MRNSSAAIMVALLIMLTEPASAGDGAVAYTHYARGDFVAAYREYRALAEAGYAHYQRQVASMHAEGEGVAKDWVQAYAWYALAASQGDSLGRENLDRLGQLLRAEQLRQARGLAQSYGSRYIAPHRPHWQLPWDRSTGD